MNSDRGMSGKEKSTQQNRPAGNTESTQMRNGQKTMGGAGGKRSGGMGPVSQQSGRQGSAANSKEVETDGGAPSAQTSGAKDESGQL